MEAFARVIIIITAALFAVLIFERWYGLERRRTEAADNAISTVYRSIRKNRVITAADLITLYETAALVNGELVMIAGCERETVAENGEISTYKEYLFYDDIKEIIENEGRFVMISGDSLSLYVDTEPKRIAGFLYRMRSRLFAGGLV